MSILTDDMRLALAEYRRKALDGTLTLEEMKAAVRLMREGRISAAARSEKSRAAKAAPAAIDSDAMLNDLLK